MGKIVINGGRRLNGELKIQGSKNAVLPILAACVLCDGECVLKNCPEISDVRYACEIIQTLGGKTSRTGETLIIDTRQINHSEINKALMHKMRSSVMFLGPILARTGKAVIYTPGGCEIGSRPIDLHIKALKSLGASVIEEGDKISCYCQYTVTAKIHLPFPSVGATENVMMASVFSKGTVVISNPAMEPEIVELQNFINAMGGRVHGAGTKTIVIEGVEHLKGCEYEITGDRIVCATYLFGVAIAGGKTRFTGVKPEDLEAVLSVLREMGCDVSACSSSITIQSSGELKGVRKVQTQVFPGFPTDAQAPLTAALCVASGITVVHEEIFENRFRHIEELVRMGADITVENRIAIICGVPCLYGTTVHACELRGAGALVVAGLGARGKTIVEGTEYLDRGYDKMEQALERLGADIIRM